MNANKHSVHPDELILASASPRRSELLKRIGLSFKICPANVRELDGSVGSPEEMVMANARLKAEALRERFPNALIMGSDTTVSLEDTVLNKPVDMKEARTMLKQLSGRTHRVYTAVALLWSQGDLFDGFVEALLMADYQLVLPIYAASETDTQEVSSSVICDALRSLGAKDAHAVCDNKSLFEILDRITESNDVVLFMGAGSVGRVAKEFIERANV